MLGVLLGSTNTYLFTQFGTEGVIADLHLVAIAPEDNAGQVQVVVANGDAFVGVRFLIAYRVVGIVDVLSSSGRFETARCEFCGAASATLCIWLLPGLMVNDKSSIMPLG